MNTTKTFSVVALLLAVISLAVGYAAISNVNLRITGQAKAVPNSENFKVLFDNTKEEDIVRLNDNEEDSITIDSDKVKASFVANDLVNVDETVEFKFRILNQSEDLKALINGITITPDSDEYFDVSVNGISINDEILANDSLEFSVIVKLKKAVVEEVSKSFTIDIPVKAVEA